MHAAVEYCVKYPERIKDWHTTSQTVVLLTVKDERWLELIGVKLKRKGLPVAWFREPDMDDQLTAIACVCDGHGLTKLPLLRGGE